MSNVAIATSNLANATAKVMGQRPVNSRETGLMALIGLALFIIACVAASGKFGGSLATLGYTFLGLGVPMIALYARKLIWNKENKLPIAIFIIFALSVLSAASLGIAGQVTKGQLTWIYFAGMGLTLLSNMYLSVKAQSNPEVIAAKRRLDEVLRQNVTSSNTTTSLA